MTQGKRIIINTVATYGRSMFGVVCGIFSTRWVLEALGHESFGLYSVIGAMAIFLGFLNIQFSGAIARYYAFSIGQAQRVGNEAYGLKECRSWFTTAIMIHTVLPLVMIAIGWPIGEYAITHAWLKIPEARIGACLWVWRIICMSSFIGMFNVPFQAMYTAKQYIAELTIYSFFQTIARTVFIFFMTFYKCDWLVKYALAMAIVAIMPQLIICVRAMFVFKECRIVYNAFCEFRRIKDLSCYALWTAIGGLGFVASHQCMSVLINNYFGAKIVAGFGVSQTVAGEAASLNGALQGAFTPAITTTYGSSNLEQFRTMSFWACKAGTLLTLMFAIPMALEIDELLLLWLKNPPPMAAQLCVCALSFIVIEKLTSGHSIAVNATGKIAKYQILRGILRCFVIPFALIPIYLNLGVVATAMALPISAIIVDLGDVWLAHKIVGMSFRYWCLRIVLPICIISMFTILIGIIPRQFLSQSFIRMVVTTIETSLIIISLSWLILLSQSERELVKNKIVGFKNKGYHKGLL